jgi:hypothetical protein
MKQCVPRVHLLFILSILQAYNINENSYDATILNETITREEIAKAVEHAKLLNACGIDEIHAEVLKNSTAVHRYNPQLISLEMYVKSLTPILPFNIAKL